jgi:AraC-like DNA-binding protein
VQSRPRAKRRRRPLRLPCGSQAALEQHLRCRERPCNRCLLAVDTYTDHEIAELIQEQRERDRELRLWQQFGITRRTFERIFEQQGYCCGCCRSTDARSDQGWHVDHDHVTGAIRGVLCARCNTGIGMLGDRVGTVRSAIAYLEAHALRGGYSRDPEPPVRGGPTRYSERIRECFKLFDQGISRVDAVIRLRQHPDIINDIYVLWSRERESSKGA